jgi:non-ribosomal peptide synthetase component F
VSEQDGLVVSANQHDRPRETATVPALVDQWATRQPDKTAVASSAGSISYRELARRSNRLARNLLANGLRPEERVAIRVPRGPDLLVAMLGVLKAGGAYVPLDPELPPERLAYITEDSGARCVLTHAELAAVVAESGADDHPPDVVIHPQQLAYVIYTSGSTGRPKAVQIQHGSLVNLLTSMREAPGLSDRDTWLALATVSFDMSVPELYLPLIVGATTFLVSRDDARDPFRLEALLVETGATVLEATPSTWRMLLQTGWRGDRRLLGLIGAL